MKHRFFAFALMMQWRVKVNPNAGAQHCVTQWHSGIIWKMSHSNQGWEFAHSLISLKSNQRLILLLVCFMYEIKKKIEKISQSLIFAHFLFFDEQCEWIAHSAHIKWAMWANRSGCSPKRNDHERFAQIAHQKWANEWIAHSLIFGQNTSDSLGNQMSEFPALIRTPSPY